MEDFRRLFPFLRPHLPRLALAFLLLVCAGVAEVLTTALPIWLFDEVLISAQVPAGSPAAGAQRTELPANSAMEKLQFLRRALALLPGGILAQLSMGLLVFILVKGICIYYSNYGMSHVGQSVVLDLRNMLFDHVLKQSMGFFALNSTGRLMSRMNSDVEQVQEAVSTSVAELFREGVLLIALVAWVFYIDWRMASLALIIAPVALVLTLIMGRRIRRAGLKSRESIATLNDLLQQSISGMRIVKAFGMEVNELDRYRKSGRSLLRANMRAAGILFLNSPLMELLGIICFIPMLFYAYLRIAQGTLTVGTFSGLLFALFRMYDPIRKLSRLHVQFQRAFASASRVTELLDTHIEIHDKPDAVPLRTVNEGIEFHNVHFAYQDASGNARVLEDINLNVQPRKVVALVGSSGAGKTTLAALIPRFYDVTGGRITIDGTDIRDFTQSSLRRNIAMVTQETFLFNDTIRSNIAYGDIHAGDDQIAAAAKAALAHDFIMSFPQKYDTIIGERGQRLSGGERQRIAIARAILKNSPILILDEATSALDSESEQLVQLALSNLMRNRTTFVIAHRLSTIRNADVILVLHQGRIVEIGKHEDLIAARGPYHRFYRLQSEEALTSSPPS